VPDILYGKGSYRRDNGSFPELKLVNMFPEKAPTVEQGVAILSRPGLRRATGRGPGPIREVYQRPGLFNGDIFTLSGNQLFRNDTYLGTIDGDQIPRVASSKTELVITCGQSAWSYIEGNLSRVTMPDEFPVISVAFINNTFVYIKRYTNKFYWSAVNNGRSVDALAFGSAEMAPDDLRDVITVGDNMFLLGQESIEVYYWQGDNPRLPFTRINQRTTPKGVIGTGAATLFDNALHFIGNDGVVYRMAEVAGRISNHGLEERIGESAFFRLFTFTFQGHAFLCMRLDVGTWVFDPAGGAEWPEFTTHNLGNFLGQCATTPETGVMFGSSIDNSIFEFGDEWTDAGERLIRQFTAALPIAVGSVPVDHLEVECSAGTINQFDWPHIDPQLEVRASRDGGKEFTMWRTARLGGQGEHRWRPRYRRFGYFDAPGALFDFRCVDPMPLRVSAVRVNEAAGGRQR
jgi:hypothetical protein